MCKTCEKKKREKEKKEKTHPLAFQSLWGKNPQNPSDFGLWFSSSFPAVFCVDAKKFLVFWTEENENLILSFPTYALCDLAGLQFLTLIHLHESTGSDISQHRFITYYFTLEREKLVLMTLRLVGNVMHVSK